MSIDRTPGILGGPGTSQGSFSIVPVKSATVEFRTTEAPAAKRRRWGNKTAEGPSIQDLEERLRFLIMEEPPEGGSSRVRKVTITFLSGKGGTGVTTLMAFLSAIIADVTRKSTAAIDAHQFGNLARVFKLGHGDTATPYSLLTALPNITTHADFEGQLSTVKDGVSVVAAERVPSAKTWLNGEEYTRVVNLIRDNTMFLLQDASPSLHEPVTTAAVSMADVLVFVVLAGSPMSAELCCDVMEAISNQHIASRATRSVIVGNFAPPADHANDWQAGFKIQGPAYVSVPFDPILQQGLPLNRSSLSSSTYRALLEVAIAIFEKASRPTER